MEKEKGKMPDSIILDDERRKIRVSWMTILSSAQNAYDYLKEDKDIGECLPEFDVLTSEWIEKFIAEKINAVMKSPDTYKVKMKAVEEWRAVERDLQEKMNKINALRNLDQNAKIEQKACHLCITNLDELLAERSKFIVPNWYHDYYTLICDVNAAIIRLREFEVQNCENNQIELNSIGFHADNPENLIKYLIRIQELSSFKNAPKVSHVKQEGITFDEQERINQQLEKEDKERHQKYLKLKEENKKKLEIEGKRTFFGTGVIDKTGKVTPIK